MVNIDIYTDGGCRGNPGIGAYAMIVYKDGQSIFKLGDYVDKTTNNKMELTALISALNYISVQPDKCNYRIYSDSQYVVNSFNDYLDDWIFTGRIYTRPNKDLWIYVSHMKDALLYKGININLYKVEGHSSDVRNIEVDKLVNSLMDEKKKLNIKLNHPTIEYLVENQLKGFSEVTEGDGNTEITEVPESRPEVEVSKITYVPESKRLKFLLEDGTSIEVETEGIKVPESIELEKSFINM